MATGVHRNLAPDDALASVLTRNAFSVSGDSVLRFGDYEMQGYLGVSYVGGSPGAILRLQRASARYFQRPDVDYVQIDPLRTTMTGAKGGFAIERQNARHWLWEITGSFETPDFETNDIGRLTTGDGQQITSEVEYQQTTPSTWYRNYSVTLGHEHEWTFGGTLQTSSLESEVSMTWPNFWSTDWTTVVDFPRQDMRLTRGGPSMGRPRAWTTGVEVETSDAAETRGSTELRYGRTEDGGLIFTAGAGLTMQPGSQWQLSINPLYEREVETQQYVTTLPGGGPATYGRQYVFGHIDRSTYSTQVRLNYTFKPDLNLDFYGEPFAASGRYDSYGALAAARSRLLVPVDPGIVGSRDFNVRSFRSNLVLRWEWRPGSTLYLVWQQDRETEEALRARASLGDMFGSLGARGDNFFAVKASFWFSPQ
jgi:hypothetical protein